jgi:hypothetical protein
MGKLRASAAKTARTQPTAPVETRNVLDDLTPSMRTTALRMSRDSAGRPDPSRIVVLGRGSFEVLPPQR